MIVFGGDNPRAILIYGLVVLAILAFSYFVIIKPITDTTNSTVNKALQQSNRAISQGFKQAAPVQSAGQGQLNRAQRQARRAIARAKKQLKQAEAQAAHP
jgi:F0F1-type ATP synthase membrane subunit b/b'